MYLIMYRDCAKDLFHVYSKFKIQKVSLHVDYTKICFIFTQIYTLHESKCIPLNNLLTLDYVSGSHIHQPACRSCGLLDSLLTLSRDCLDKSRPHILLYLGLERVTLMDPLATMVLTFQILT